MILAKRDELLHDASNLALRDVAFYDEAGKVIETHEQAGRVREP